MGKANPCESLIPVSHVRGQSAKVIMWSEGPGYYAYNDKDKNGLIDANELVCRVTVEDPCCLDDAEIKKVKRLGTAASFYRRLIAGYSRTSDVLPHEKDNLFHKFFTEVSSEMKDRFKKSIDNAEAAHRKNAARDLDRYVREKVRRFFQFYDIACHSGRDMDVAVKLIVENDIQETLEQAESNGVKVKEYYAPLSASLQVVLRNFESKCRQGENRSSAVNRLKKLIQTYTPANE